MAYRGVASEARFFGLLAKEFRKPTYAILKQVPIPVRRHDGWGEQRVDAIVVGAWESREAAILGFEIKASRSSWLSELKDPPKAEGAAVFCDAWYILADQDVVQAKELPQNWGLYVPKRGSLELVKPAKKIIPRELPREAIFSVLKEFMVQVNSTSVKTAFKRSYDLGYQAGKSEAGKLFNEVLQRIMADRKPDELERLRGFLTIGPHELRPGRIDLMEKLFESFTKWNSLQPTKAAIKAIEFLSDRGFGKCIKQLSDIEVDVEKLLNFVKESRVNAEAGRDEIDRLGLTEQDPDKSEAEGSFKQQEKP